MVHGHRWRTLFLVKEVRFSMTVTRAPSSWASMAVRRPMGPAPTTTSLVLEASMLSPNTPSPALSSSSLNSAEHLIDLTFSWKRYSYFLKYISEKF